MLLRRKSSRGRTGSAQAISRPPGGSTRIFHIHGVLDASALLHRCDGVA